MITRENTRPIQIDTIQMGQQNKVLIQSMTNTKTKDIKATIKQIKELENAGCDIIRVAVLDTEDADAIRKIKDAITIPLVADIHFDYRLALKAVDAGADKIRINPGNIGNIEHTKEVVNKCKEHKIPIRIGINSGSIEKRLLDETNQVTAEIMIQSAREHIEILESLDFYDIAISLKASDVQLTIDAYRLAAKSFNYPLHLGVTEAGTLQSSTIKSAAALGVLLEEGLGDTIRISITGDPLEEILVAKKLLSNFNLTQNTANLISCPTCGRLEYDMIPIAQEIEAFLATIHHDLDVAVMGCAVNGPQEASRADIGVAGGKEEALLFKKGKIIKKVPQSEIVDVLKSEIMKMIA